MKRGDRAGWALLLAVCVGCGEPLVAQSVDVGDVREEYLRLLQLSGEAPLGSFTVRPVIFRPDVGPLTPGTHPWAGRGIAHPSPSRSVAVAPFVARMRVFVNSRSPINQNDDAVWQGRGLTTALDFGTSVRWRGVRVALVPTASYTQNAYFDLAPVSVADQPVYAYPWREIDLPQRFGPDARWELGAGQSEVRVSGRGVSAGVSTRSLWWGPGIQNAIIMSNNAAGFPHVFLGTQGPRRIGIGTIEANWTLGKLDQSDYFGLPVETDARFHAGLVVTFNPDLLPGLSLGFTRVFYGASPNGLEASNAFLVFQGVTKKGQEDSDSPTGDDDKDQLLSVFGRWVLEDSGFEVYGEWSRNDHSLDLTEFVLQPEHSQGYMLGLQKAYTLPDDRRVAMRVELTHLEREATFRVRASPVYYAHHIVTQGYTHRGQVIGAGVGPGGIHQHIGADLYAPWGRAGVLFQRRVADNDAYYEWAVANGAEANKHDVSLDAGVRGHYFVSDVQLGGQLILTRQLNRYFDGPNVWNLNVGLTARWRPR